MRRPVCLVGLSFVIMILLYLYIWPYEPPAYEKLENSKIVVTGLVDQKEYRVSYDRSIPVIYLKDIRFLYPETGENSINIKTNTVQNAEYDITKNNITKEDIADIEGLLCYIEEGEEPSIGSRICVEGKFRAFKEASNQGEFDAASYYQILNLQGSVRSGRIVEQSDEYDHFREKLYEIKNVCGQLLDQCYRDAEASLLKAMLLGDKRTMDEELKALYQQNGIIHILSISGLHISLIGMGLYKLLHRLRIPLFIRVIVSISVMYCYGIMTGMGVSAVRAIFMFALHLGAMLLGRTYDMLTALSLAALLVLMKQPLYVRHSGFLFSFTAILAIGLFLPEVEMSMLGKSKLEKLIASGLAVSIATFPIYLYYYYEYPLYSVFLNLLVIPGAAFLVAGGLLSLLLSYFLLPLGKAAALPVSVLFACYEGLCRLTLRLPGSACIIGQPVLWQIALFVGILCLVTAFGERISKLQFWQGILLAFLCITLRLPEGLQITLIDVGQGDGIYLSDGEGGRYLIDGGSSDKSSVGTYQILPFLKSEGTDYLDAVILTHLDSDHYNGIEELLEQCGVGGVGIGALMLPDVGVESRTESYLSIEKLAESKDIPIHYLHTGDTISHDMFKLTCLFPDAGIDAETNAASIVLYLEYEAFTALFTGDLEGNGEKLVRERLKAFPSAGNGITMLKVAHHGSAYSTDTAFIQSVSPEIALISAGRNNRYGHPHEELLKRLESADCHIMRTDKGGAINLFYQNGKIKLQYFLEEMAGQ